MKHMTDYESDLHEWLKSPENAAAYLNAVLEEGDKSAMLLALREVAQANDGWGNCRKIFDPARQVSNCLVGTSPFLPSVYLLLSRVKG